MAVATRVADVARGPFIGSYTGTSAAQQIHIGFKPALIYAWNRTDGDTVWMWSKADIVNVKTIVAAVANLAAAVTQIDNGTVLGFSLPVDAVINENAKVYDFIAFPE
jgi:hypothetical protein